MIPVLYNANTTDFSTFGIGALADVISCEVTEERNGSFECVFQYPVSGQHYSEIQRERIVKAKPNDTSADQAFRIYRITTPLNGIVKVYAQHISYDLTNIAAVPWVSAAVSPQVAIDHVFANAVTSHNFTFHTDYTTPKVFSVSKPKSLRAVLGGEEGSLVSLWGGEFEWDNFLVKHHQGRGQNLGVVVEYGKNLTKLEQDVDNSGVYTQMLPYAIATDEQGTETLVTLTEQVLPITVSILVHQKTLIKDFTDSFDIDDTITEAALRTKAQNYLANNPLGVEMPSITIAFEPLWKQPEYVALLERVSLCDTVTVRHTDLGISVRAKVIKTVYDTLTEKYVSITLGSTKNTLINTIQETNSAAESANEKVNRFPSLVATAINNATQRITGQTGGYVVLHTNNAAGTPYELLVLDAPSIDTAVNVWRWNVGGLGFSSHGYNGPYETAITSDGKIVADFITSGTLVANIIKAGILSSVDGTSYWNLDTGEVVLRAYATTSDVEEVSDRVDDVEDDMEDAQTRVAGLETTTSELVQTAAGLTTRVSNAEGNITTLNQNVAGITTRVSTAEGNISTLTQNVSGVTARVTTAEGNISTLSVNVSGLTTRVTNAEGDISDIETSVSGILTRVSTAEGNITTITQNVSSVTTRVATAEGSITTLTADVNGLKTRMTNAEGDITDIEASVSGISTRVTTAEGNISTITQNVSSITTRVSTAEGNISTITQNVSSVTTRVSTAEGKITTHTTDINGLKTRVTNAEGDITDLSATVDGIESRVTNAEGDISTISQTVSGISTRVGTAEGNISTLQQTTSTISATVANKADKSGGTQASFGWSLTSSGFYLYSGNNTVLAATSTGISVSGQINANSGTLGTLTINGKLTFGGNSSYFIDANNGDSSYYIKLPGLQVDDSSGAVFSGNLSAPSGTIGGFTISTYSIYNGKSSYSSTSADGVYIGTDGIGLGKGLFYVTKAGYLYASYVTVSGSVTATSGTIAGFTVSSGKLYYTKTSYSSSVAGVYLGTDGIGLGAGSFYVTSAGALTATSATITGAITATSGSLSTMTVTGYLYFGGNSSYYINANYNDGSYYIYLPGFRVDNASGAVFSGKLSAPTGTIGGFTIDTSKIYKTKTSYSDSNTGVYLGTDGIGLGAGTFYVTSAGALHATNATITGTITNAASDGWGVKIISNRVEFLQNSTTVCQLYGSSGLYRANMTTTTTGLVCTGLLRVSGDLVCGKCFGVSTGNGIYVSGKLALTMGQIKVQTNTNKTRYLLFYCGILVGISASIYSGITDYSVGTYDG